MSLFGVVVIALIAGTGLAALARRLHAPYPAFLALGGIALAWIPDIPQIAIDPQLALTVFVAPVLVSAAYDASLRDLRDNWIPITTLSTVAVSLTVIGVTLVALYFEPSMPLWAAVALGALVAPPDAVAAAAVLRQVSPPRRLMVILEGESLFNDATSLLIYAFAIGAGAAAVITAGDVVIQILKATVVSAVLGYAFARVFIALLFRIQDIPTAIVFEFAAAFLVWSLAEQFHLSAIVAVVVFGITLARAMPRMPLRLRVDSQTVWGVAVFVLNVLAFVLMGSQLRPVVESLTAAGSLGNGLALAGAVTLTVIIVRIAWVMTYNSALRWKNARFGISLRRPMMKPTLAGGLILAWCGMRGIVTIAAALAFPDGPHRDLIVLTAFAVVLGTLIIQGFTLGALIRWANPPEDATAKAESLLARKALAQSALESLKLEDDAAKHRQMYEHRLRTLADENDPAAPDPIKRNADLRLVALNAERGKLEELRREGVIGDDVFRELLDELDIANLGVNGRLAAS